MSGYFLLATFKETDESLYLSISEDGISFDPLYGGFPILTSHIGNRSIRDPFIFKDSDRLFHLLATDGFHGVSIFHAVSDDLFVWRNQELIRPFSSLNRVKNLWAPKAFKELDGSIAITWSSTLSMYPSQYPNNHRIWISKTRCFQKFTAPRLWFNPKFNCIDFCPFTIGTKLFGVFKDERGTYGTKPDVRNLRTVQHDLLTGAFGEISDEIIKGPAEGPCLYRYGETWFLLYDRYTVGKWGGASSDDFITWCNLQISVPEGSRHGSVLELTCAEHRRLIAASS